MSAPNLDMSDEEERGVAHSGHIPHPGGVRQALAANRLGLWSLVFLIISAAAPLTVVAGGATAGFAVTGLVGLPVTYLASVVLLALFAVGWVDMATRIPNAGAFYAYIRHGYAAGGGETLGRVVGLAAAGVALLAYNALQIGLIAGLGAVTSSWLQTRFGIEVAWWLLALLGISVIGAMGVARIDFSGRVLAVLLTAETTVVVIIDALAVTHPADGTVSLTTLNPSHLVATGIGAALAICITGFVGCEAAAVFAEEVRDRERTVRHAVTLALLITGIVYAGSTWALTVYTGPDNIIDAAAADPAGLFIGIGAVYLGTLFADLANLLFITSLFAAALAYHNTVARYLFSLGRERALPLVAVGLGRTNRSGAPRNASLTQTALAVSTVVVWSLLGWDPLLQLFFAGTVLGGTGVVLLMASTSFAVGLWFWRHGYSSRWRHLVAPFTAGAALAVVSALIVDNFELLVGAPPEAQWPALLPGAYGMCVIGGVLWGLWLRHRRPDAFDVIGLGPVATRLGPMPVQAPTPAVTSREVGL